MSETGLRRQVHLLIPIWGESYVNKWIELSLPTYLASRNLPALAKMHDVQLTLLTNKKTFEYFRQQPIYSKLSQLVKIQFVDIADILASGLPYSVTITRAFARGMFGDHVLEPTETAFVILVSDYIFANGSLETLGKKIGEGHRAIFQGNFGAIEEEIEPKLRKMIGEQGVLEIESRDLVRMGIQHMHPVTTARFLDQTILHHTYPNRFFWRVNSRKAMVGRFFLLHPICLVPEVKLEDVGGFADYFLFPACVPSRNAAILNDSDEFFILEPEPTLHETKGLRMGAFEMEKLANHLSYWTTAEHRQFSESPIIYRGEDISPKEQDAAVADSLETIQAIRRRMTPKPVSLENHPYWMSATNGESTLGFGRVEVVKRSFSLARLKPKNLWLRINSVFRQKLMASKGVAPYLKVWQPHWVDFVSLGLLCDEMRDKAFFYHSNGTNTADGAFLSLPGCHAVRDFFSGSGAHVGRVIKDLPESGQTHIFYLLPKDEAVIEHVVRLTNERPQDRVVVFAIGEKPVGAFDVTSLNGAMMNFLTHLASNGRKGILRCTSPGVKTFLNRMRYSLGTSDLSGKKRLFALGLYGFLLALEILSNIRIYLRGSALVQPAGQFNYSIYFDCYQSGSPMQKSSKETLFRRDEAALSC